MEILIAVFSGVAFLALIVYLWNSDVASKQDKHDAVKEESLSPERIKPPHEASLNLSTIESEHVAELERKLDAQNREHADSFKAFEEYKEKATANQFELCEAQASAAQSSQKVAELEADNTLLHSRLAEMDTQQSRRQNEIASLEYQLAKLGAFEQQVGILQKEKAELMEQLEKFQTENAANARATLTLQDLEAKQSDYEAKLASLRDENHRLLGEITGLQSSLRDKIKTQLDGLQELYRNLTPGLN
jgi:chromosome segregation ATPase